MLGIEQLRYLAQDETRIGRKTETAKVVSAKGVKPKVKVAWPREAFWLSGVVAPLTGWQWMQEDSKLDGENFQQFINSLCEQLGTTVAVIQMDRAPAPERSSHRVAGEHHPDFSACSLSRTQSD